MKDLQTTERQFTDFQEEAFYNLLQEQEVGEKPSVDFALKESKKWLRTTLTEMLESVRLEEKSLPGAVAMPVDENFAEVFKVKDQGYNQAVSELNEKINKILQ